MVDIITVINTVFTLMQSKSSNFSTLFVSDGVELLMALGFIVAAWHVVVMLLDGNMPGFYVSEFRHVIKTAVLLVMLTGWTGTVHDYIAGGMQQMTDKVTGGDSSLTTVATIGLSAISTIMTGSRQQATSPCETVPSLTPDGQIIPGATQQDCSGAAAATGSSGAVSTLAAFGYAIKNLPLIIITAILKVLSIAALALMILFYIIFVQMGSLLLNLAFMFGPVMIPWFLLGPTEFLFDSWLRFTISAGLFKVVAAAMMVMTSAIVPGIQTFVNAIAATNGTAGDEYYGTNYLASIGIMIVCGLGAYMMWQVPDISGRLVGGGTGASSRGMIGGVMRFIP